MKYAEVTYNLIESKQYIASVNHELNEHNRENGIMMESSLHCLNKAEVTYILIESKQ